MCLYDRIFVITPWSRVMSHEYNVGHDKGRSTKESNLAYVDSHVALPDAVQDQIANYVYICVHDDEHMIMEEDGEQSTYRDIYIYIYINETYNVYFICSSISIIAASLPHR